MISFLDLIKETPRIFFTNDEQELINKIKKTNKIDKESIIYKFLEKKAKEITNKKCNEEKDRMELFVILNQECLKETMENKNNDLYKMYKLIMERDYGITDLDMYEKICNKTLTYMSYKDNLKKTVYKIRKRKECIEKKIKR